MGRGCACEFLLFFFWSRTVLGDVLLGRGPGVMVYFFLFLGGWSRVDTLVRQTPEEEGIPVMLFRLP